MSAGGWSAAMAGVAHADKQTHGVLQAGVASVVVATPMTEEERSVTGDPFRVQRSMLMSYFWWSLVACQSGDWGFD